ncbi:MAG: hypothetical protein Kow00106_00370 [Anaerolineae bacterium]
MNEHTRITEELVAYTDDLLAGGDPAPPPGIKEEARIVRALNRLIGPAAGPNIAFRQRLRQQLAVQWEKEHAAEVSRSGRGRWRMWSLVAGVAVIMLVIVLGTSTRGDFGTDTRGTALGAGVWVTVLALGALAGGALWWRGRRR